MTRRVVDAVAPVRGECWLEIGPGLGVLTWPIVEAGARVVAVEKDPRLAVWLRARLGARDVAIVEGDAAVLDPDGLARDAWGGDAPYRIASNLPYGISAVVLAGLARGLPRLRRAVIMLQAEVAGRLTASPATADYGALTAAVRRVWRVRTLQRVPAACFWPRPEVESRVVELVPDPEAVVLKGVEERWFRDLLRAGFGQRRKQMRTSLGGLPASPDRVGAALRSVGARPEDRFETLSVDRIVELARILARAAEA